VEHGSVGEALPLYDVTLAPLDRWHESMNLSVLDTDSMQIVPDVREVQQPRLLQHATQRGEAFVHSSMWVCCFQFSQDDRHEVKA
jgi:hypothetical protein